MGNPAGQESIPGIFRTHYYQETTITRINNSDNTIVTGMQWKTQVEKCIQIIAENANRDCMSEVDAVTEAFVKKKNLFATSWFWK